MSKNNKYLIQSNFFTGSFFNLEKDIHKDVIYLIQQEIDFFGAPRDVVTLNFKDYLKSKNIQRSDTYPFAKFQDSVNEIKSIGGAFRNKINNTFVSFNLIDNVQINVDDAESLNIHLAKFGKIFFFKSCLEEYITGLNPVSKISSYSGHTKIENSIIKIRGFRRKKFFELISQFKSTGFFKISLAELKFSLGFIQIINKESKEPIKNAAEQFSFMFSPDDDKYELLEIAKRYSVFERDFLIPAIKAINTDLSKDINNLMIAEKLKTGRKISHLVFKFNSLKKVYTREENQTLDTFKKLGLDETQILFLLKRIGYMEMYKRYNQLIEKRVDNPESSKEAKYYNKNNPDQEIKNMGGFMYRVVFPELSN
ncbi:replication initiation protein [Tenacibaculum ovolyticum]|uniref:replication initiation protein n=1 Tax=Tenacibaculum ovolyticum TaxID=104270 RepID=UPI0007ECE16F|nr:replication initiation protein [Tenacibaculum ovolyticum]